MSTTYTPNDNAIGLQLASGYTAGSGSIILKSGQGAKFVNFPTCVTLITNATYNTGATESLTVFTVTGKSTDTLTGVVVASGYTDTAYATNDYCEDRVNALYLTAVIANLGSATLTPTAVKTANYTAVVGDFVPVSVASGSVTITLPTAPANKSQIAIQLVTPSGANTVTVAAGGSDVFTVAGGATTLAMAGTAQLEVLQYNSATSIWYIIASHNTTSAYAQGANITITTSGGTRTIAASGGTPGGTTGQIQYDNAGAFGGFTASGDFTINTATGVGTVTKTNGVAFAASATTDATVATNITTGNLPVAQLPSIATLTVLSNTTGGTAAAGANTISSVLGAGFPNLILPTVGPPKRAGGLQFKCGLCTSVGNTAVATSIFGTPANTSGTLTIPANQLTIGSLLRWNMTGVWGCTASSPTIGFNVILNGTSILLPQSLLTLSTVQSGSPPFFSTTAFLNIQAIGASALAGGVFLMSFVNPGAGSLGTTSYPGGGGGPAGSVSFASNANALFDIQVVFSAANASNFFTLQSFQLFLDN